MCIRDRTKATEETKENESESSTSETDESIIDGETDLELSLIHIFPFHGGSGPGQGAQPVDNAP